MTDPDLALLARYRNRGDEQAFDQIVRRYSGPVFATCHRILRDHARAEDVSQETFCLLFAKPEAVTKSLGGWLHRAATRLAIDTIRSDSSRLHREASYTRKLRITEASQWEDMAPHVDECLELLPEELSALVVAHFLGGVPQHELATRLRVSPPTVSRRIKHALAELRKHLLRRGVLVAPPLLVGLIRHHAAGPAPAALAHALGRTAAANHVVPPDAGASTSTLGPFVSPGSLTFAASLAAAVAIAFTGLFVANDGGYVVPIAKPAHELVHFRSP